MTALLQIHNTLSGKKEPFQPLQPNRVSMYVCGITPYDECHLGHARCYVTFDFIRRALARLGYNVTCVQNFTDIDDKIIHRANERGETPGALAERYIGDYFDKMDKLNIKRADMYPRVTGHIPQIISFIEKLIAKGKAYPLEGDVYYSVREFPTYGKLSKRKIDDLLAGARVGVDERKKDPLDFALWKTAKAGEPAWDSPWGPGRPGWHIECSVMSIENLKMETFDIHGGGQDLIFPHHENEIAQAEGATGKQFARVWIHNGFVTVNKEKMSKSLGNFFTLTDIFKKFEPKAVRWLLLSQHYRTPLEFSDALLSAASVGLKSLEETLHRLSASVPSKPAGSAENDAAFLRLQAEFNERLEQALADDFNAPEVLAALFTLVLKLGQASSGLSSGGLEKGIDLARAALRDVLGVETEGRSQGEDGVENLVQQREQARQSKNWAEADRLRGKLAEMNIIVEDTPQGARWWRQS